MFVGVKLFSEWIFLHQPMLAEHLQHLTLSQLQPLVHVSQVLGLLLQLLLGHQGNCFVQNISYIKKILRILF